MSMTVQMKYEYKDLQGNICTEISHISHEEGLDSLMQEIRRFVIAIGYSAEGVSEYIEEN